MKKGISPHEHPHGLPLMASQPSQTTSGTIAKAAAESAHRTFQMVFTTNPTKAISERYPHNADSTASALRAALPVWADNRLFSLASNGINAAAAIKMPIPSSVGLGWRPRILPSWKWRPHTRREQIEPLRRLETPDAQRTPAWNSSRSARAH